MKEFVAVTKAMADPTRMRLLMAIRDRELCVCQLIELVRLAPSTVSKHMGVLKQAGLVCLRKDGRWAFYQVNRTAKTPATVRTALVWASELLADDPAVLGDVARLPRLTRMSANTECGGARSRRSHAAGRPKRRAAAKK